MTIEQLREAHRIRPFRPFTMYLADGRAVAVPHHEFLAHSSSGRTVIVQHLEDTSISIIDLLLVTEIKFQSLKPRLQSNGSDQAR